MEGRKAVMIGTVLSATGAAIALAAKESFGDEAGADEIREMIHNSTVEPNGIPNRLCIDRASRFFTPHGGYVGVRLNGEDVSGRVVEFCVSDGWVRLSDQQPGAKLTYQQVRDARKSFGNVETFWRMTPSRQIRRQFSRMN